MRKFLFTIVATLLLTACGANQSQNGTTETVEQPGQQSTPLSLSGDKPYKGPNPHADLSAEQHVEVAMQHAEQGRMNEALEVLNNSGARTSWRGDIVALVSARRFKEAGDRMQTYCTEQRIGEVCLILASAYFEGEANLGIKSREIVEAYKYTKLACDHGSAAGCTAAEAALGKGELLQNVLFEPGVENRDAQLKEAIQLGADPNVTTLFTATLLQQAISEERIEAVRLLLKNGADVNFRVSDDDPTPLMYAINSGNTEMATLLLSSGADPEQTMRAAEFMKMDKQEADACDFAKRLQNTEMLELLKCAVAAVTAE